MLYCPRCRNKLEVVCNPYEHKNLLRCTKCFNITNEYIEGCSKCENIFAHRIFGKIDNENVYDPLCEQCFEKFTKKDTSQKNAYIGFDVLSIDKNPLTKLSSQ